jgi:hypothetical protein
MNPAESWHDPSQAPQEPLRAVPEPNALPPSIGHKNPNLAAFLSLFPGLGNVYNGLYMRGVTFFLVIVSLIAIVVKDHPLFGMAIAFFWLFNIIDAYRQATLINYGYAQDLGLVDLPKHPRAGQGGLMAGILLSLIGLIALADQYLDIRLDWLFDLWPFALVAIGVWLIWSSVRDRKRNAAL